MNIKLKFIIALLTVGLSFNCLLTDSFAKEDKSYEKYGLIAIAVIKADYPANDVVDYEYLGRSKQPDGEIVIDSFRFDVKDNKKDFFITVKVAHHLKNKKLINLSVAEIEK